MLNEETRRKIRVMKMGELLEVLDEQARDPQILAMPFEQRFQLIMDQYYQARYDAKIKRLINSAHLRFPRADIHDIYYPADRNLDRNLITELATCRFVENNDNIILQGYTSSGKTYIASALGKEACRHEYKTGYVRLPDLMEEYDERSLERSGKTKILKKYAAYKVLIIDEWLMSTLSEEEIAFLFELSEQRYDKASTIFCTLYRTDDWIPRLGEGTFAESIYERYQHDAITIELGEMNMRSVFKNGTMRTTLTPGAADLT